MTDTAFQFKKFVIEQDKCAMKIGTDGVLLGAWADVDGANKILDIGTGTGVIAIMAAQRTTDAQVHAVEIDKEAFAQAQSNMQNSPWNDRLKTIHTSIQDFAQLSRDTYDLIISNPPFFSGGTFSQSHSRNEVRHTIKLPTGELLSSARRLLSDNGRFCVILPFIEGLRFQEQAQVYGFHCTKITEVKPKADKPVERLLLQLERSHTPLPIVKNQLVIQFEARNDYTEEYIALTKDFYLKM